MNRFKKLVLTGAALAALAVGAAAFAQAQSAGSVAQTQVQTRPVEAGTPGDPADAPSAEDRGQADGGEADGSEVDAPESKADKPDAAGAQDQQDGPGDRQGADTGADAD